MGRDWLWTWSAVAGATFMNEIAPYAMQAPPLKRRTRQRFTEFDYSVNVCIIVSTWKHNILYPKKRAWKFIAHSSIEALHEFIDCLQTRFESVYPTVKMAWCSPFNKCCYQPIVITMISLWMRRTVVLGLWSYFFWMYLSSPPYFRYHTSYAMPLYASACLVLFKFWEIKMLQMSNFTLI